MLVATGRLKSFRACCAAIEEASEKGHHDRPRSRRSARGRRSATRSRWSRARCRSRNQLRRDRRAEPQLCGPEPRQPRLDEKRRSCIGAARRCAPGPGQDARQPRARPGPGHFPAAPTPQPRVARRAWRGDRRRRSGARRQCHVGLGDVGGQCRDRLARARHGGRQVPPDRRQSEDHAAPQPRMAGDVGAAEGGIRRRAHSRSTRPSRPRSATKARPITCGWPRRMASRGSRFSSMAYPAAPSRRASISKRRRRLLGFIGSIPDAVIFAEQSEQAIAAGAFHNDVVAVANERVLFAHEQAFADKAALFAACERLRARVRLCRGARRRSAAGRRDPLLSVQRPAGDAARPAKRR